MFFIWLSSYNWPLHWWPFFLEYLIPWKFKFFFGGWYSVNHVCAYLDLFCCILYCQCINSIWCHSWFIGFRAVFKSYLFFFSNKWWSWCFKKTNKNILRDLETHPTLLHVFCFLKMLIGINCEGQHPICLMWWIGSPHGVCNLFFQN